MKNNLKDICDMYGRDCLVYIPCNIFSELSDLEELKDFKQLSFAFSYIVVNAFLHKYTMYIGSDGEMNAADYKELLGYSRETRTINHIIKSGGLLEKHGYISRNKNYITSRKEVYDTNKKFLHYRFFRIHDENKEVSDIIKSRVKNKAYESPEPIFLVDSSGVIKPPNYFFKITISEVLRFVLDTELSNTDMAMYFFIKSNTVSSKERECKHLSYELIENTLPITSNTISKTISSLEKSRMVSVDRSVWSRDNSQEKRATQYTVIYGIGL